MSASCMSATAFVTLKRIAKHAQTHGHRVPIHPIVAFGREKRQQYISNGTTTESKQERERAEREKINIK